MFIDNINHQNINTKINFLGTHTKTQQKESDNFFDNMKMALEAMSKNEKKTKDDSEKFILDQPEVSLNDIMINLEKSSMSIQMATQIRNKVLAAYQEIMSQQI